MLQGPEYLASCDWVLIRNQQGQRRGRGAHRRLEATHFDYTARRAYLPYVISVQGSACTAEHSASTSRRRAPGAGPRRWRVLVLAILGRGTPQEPGARRHSWPMPASAARSSVTSRSRTRSSSAGPFCASHTRRERALAISGRFGLAPRRCGGAVYWVVLFARTQ